MKKFLHSEETKAKLSKNLTKYNLSKGHKIEIMNIEENTKTVYESIRKAALSFNINHGTIRNYIKSGKLYKGIYKINSIKESFYYFRFWVSFVTDMIFLINIQLGVFHLTYKYSIIIFNTI